MITSPFFYVLVVQGLSIGGACGEGSVGVIHQNYSKPELNCSLSSSSGSRMLYCVCIRLCRNPLLTIGNFFSKTRIAKLGASATLICHSLQSDPREFIGRRAKDATADLKACLRKVLLPWKTSKDTLECWLGVDRGGSPVVGEPVPRTNKSMLDVVEVGHIRFVRKSRNLSVSSGSPTPMSPGKGEKTRISASLTITRRMFSLASPFAPGPSRQEDPSFGVTLWKEIEKSGARRNNHDHCSPPVFQVGLKW